LPRSAACVRGISRAGCCGVYPADEARLLREQQLRKAGQEQLVLNDAMFHAGVARCAARAIAMASSVVDAAASGWQKALVLIEGGTVNSRYWTLAKRPPPP
jgi:hypothetical protein